MTITNNINSGLTLALTNSLYSTLLRSIHLNRLFREDQILTACKQKFIPATLLPPSTLPSDLLTLQSTLATTYHALALPPTDLLRYYQLPLCECKHTKDHIYLHLKIPITRQGQHWSLFELITNPFRWNHQVCSIEHPPTLLAVSERNIRPISGLSLHNCRPHDTKLCYLPRFSTAHLHGPSCAQLLYTGASIETLNAHCPFKCHPSSQPTVTELTPDSFLATNLQAPAHIRCPNTSKPLDESLLNQPGALKLVIPCDCTLFSSQQEIIPTRFPCTTPGTAKPSVIHIIPAAWSNLKSFLISPVGFQSNPRFLNFTECLNTNWTTTIPFINITSHKDTLTTIVRTVRALRPSTPLHIPSIQRDSWFLIWNIVLSALTAYLLLKYNALFGTLTAVPMTHAYDAQFFFSQADRYLLWIIIGVVSIFLIWLLLRLLRALRARRRNTGPIPPELELQGLERRHQLEVEAIDETIDGRRINYILRESPGAA